MSIAESARAHRATRFIAIGLALLGAASAAAGELENNLLKCRDIAQAEKRALCYDGVVDRISAPVPAPSVRTKEPSAPDDDVASFGVPRSLRSDDPLNATASLPAEKIERNGEGLVEAIETHVREWSYTPTGLVIVVLDNGQVWRQVEGAKVRLRDRGVPNVVRISRGSLGAFLMVLNDIKRPLQVRRVDGPKRR